MKIEINSINEPTELPFEKWMLRYPARGECRACPLMDLAAKRLSECEQAFDKEWEESLEFLKAAFQEEKDPLTGEMVSDYDLQEGCIAPVIDAPDAPSALKQAMIGHISVSWLIGDDVNDRTPERAEPTCESILECQAVCKGCHLTEALSLFEKAFHNIFKGDFEYWGHRIKHVHDDLGSNGTLMRPTKNQPSEDWWTYGGFLKRINKLRLILTAEELFGWAAHEEHAKKQQERPHAQ